MRFLLACVGSVLIVLVPVAVIGMVLSGPSWLVFAAGGAAGFYWRDSIAAWYHETVGHGPGQ